MPERQDTEGKGELVQMCLNSTTESPGEDTPMENLDNDIESQDTAEDEPEMLVCPEGSNDQS
jgi:hypothetical protein